MTALKRIVAVAGLVAISGLSRLNEDWILERGARMARRDDREYREYLREEQRRQPRGPQRGSRVGVEEGCPARKAVLDQSRQATSHARGVTAQTGPLPVWIDTDPAVGVADRDVDDGFALLQAFHSPEIVVRGVSVVFGNAPLAQAWPIGLRIVGRFGPPGVRAYRGAAKASALGIETAATRALAASLRREPLVVLALGPATNVATVLKNHPELRERIVRVVAVAGRRPGQRFTTGATNPRGHRDFNFEEDPEAFRVLLASGVPLTLAPFEISSKVWLRSPDLDAIAADGAAAEWIVAPARRWLGLWTRTFGVDGFNPFDTLAVARVTSPSQLTCETLPARVDVLPDDVTEARVQGTTVARKPYLLVSRDFGAPAPPVDYCYEVSDSFKADLLRRLRSRR